MLRHPGALPGLLLGATLRDLILRADLAREGVRVGWRGARGLGRSRLNAAVVSRLRRHFGPLAPRTVLDVGAARGGYAIAAALAFPGAAVYSFEPLPGEHAVLARAGRGIRAFPCALGDRDGTAPIRVSANPGSSSLLAMREDHRREFPGTDIVGEATIAVRRLDGLVESGEIRLVRPVLAKLDVQGFEDRVIAGFGASLAGIDALVVEVSLLPLYEGQAPPETLRGRLSAAGFVPAGEFDRVVSPVTGRVCQVDEVFRRLA